MNDSDSSSIPKWYWIVGGLALLWNLMGCAAFFAELFAQEAMTQEWTEEQKQWAKDIPTWIYFFYAVAISTGVAGSIFLLMRKQWAIPAFGICTISVIIQMVYTMVIAKGLEIMGPSAAVMPCLVIVLSIAFLGFSFFAKSKSWLGNPAS